MGATDGTNGAISSEEFAEILWADLSVAFHQHFGAKWSPAVQQFYQAQQQLVLQLATLAGGKKVEAPTPPTETRILSNFTRGWS